MCQNRYPRKTFIAPTKKGLTFLGQRLFTDHRRLKRENVQRFKKRLKKRLQEYQAGALPRDTFEAQLNSWLGHARQADTFRLRKHLLRYLRSQGLNLHEKGNAWKLLDPPR